MVHGRVLLIAYALIDPHRRGSSQSRSLEVDNKMVELVKLSGHLYA